MISNEIIRLQTAKANIKSAIEAKGVTVPSATTIDGYATLVGQIQTGATEAPDNDVNFYDYDGFRVASFTIAEAKALTQAEYDAILPPAHSGLTFQEWNWTLNDITTYNRQYIDIGANYITTDGNTHIKVKADTIKYLALSIRGIGMDLTVSWGDGQSETHSYAGNAYNEYLFEHTYTGVGDYEIKISCSQSGSYVYSFILSNCIGYSIIKEINLGNYFSLINNYSLGWLDCLISITKNTDCSFIRGTWMSSVKQINVSRLSHNLTGYFPLQYHNGRVSLPKSVGAMTAALATYSNYTRLVVPDTSSNEIANNAVSEMKYVEVISIPDKPFTTLANGKFFNSNSNMVELDVVQGYTPTQSMVFSSSTKWTAETMVKLFNKLGTTNNSITLTFGSTNLDKLTADQKAIATNKGYTLA